MTHCRLKTLIKSLGGLTATATKKSNRKGTSEEDTAPPGPSRVDYVSLLIDLLREKFGNDFKLVAEYLQSESISSKKKPSKGFGTKSSDKIE